MARKLGVTYLAVAYVRIAPKFRDASSTRPPDGLHKGWYYERTDRSRVFIDTSGWLWGEDCKIRLRKISRRPAPEPMRNRGEAPSTPQRWEREAKAINFKSL